LDEGGRFSTFIRASVSEAVVFPGGFFLVVSLEVGDSFAVSEESPGERLSGIGVGKDSSVEAGGIRIDCSSKGTSVLVGNELDLAKKKIISQELGLSRSISLQTAWSFLAFEGIFFCRGKSSFLNFRKVVYRKDEMRRGYLQLGQTSLQKRRRRS